MPQRSEVTVRGDGNCFYRAVALWRDEMSDEKHEEIHRLSSALIEKSPKVFQPLLFSSNSVKEHVIKKSKITGTWAYLVVHCYLSDQFVPSRRHRKNGFTFKPIMITDLCSSITLTKKERIFLKISTSEQHTATDLVNLLCFA